jgi:hypothetical protein
VRLDTSSKLCFLLGKHTDDAGSDFMMNYSLVIFADDVDTKFLLGKIENGRTKTKDGGGGKAGVERRRTTMSPVLSSKGSDSAPSALSLSPLIKVPLELFTSLM